MSKNRLVLPLIKWTALLLGASAFSLGGCQSNDTGTAQAALTAVQGSVTTCEGLAAAVQVCLSARGVCLEAASDAAGQEACKATFVSCLPADAAKHGGKGGHHGPGKGHHGPGGGQDGSAAGGDHGGGDMANGCGPGSGEAAEDACDPGAPIVLACKADLETCLAGAADAAGCIETAKGCVATAIEERFHDMCEAHAGSCAESDADPIICEQISTACKDGLTLPEIPAIAQE